jgi:uncharacterized membrane protein/fermentation-respiration switch protein FrsA (DUF1100 family)
MSKKFLSTLKFIIGWPLSVIAILFIFKIVSPNLNIVLANIFKINVIYLLLSVTSFFTYFLLRSLLWKNIIDQKGSNLNLKKVTYIWAFSELKRYIPGNIWSILSRGTSTLETGLEKKEIANALIIEVELIIVACYVLSLPFMLYFSWGKLFDILFLIFGILLITLFIFGSKIKCGKFSLFFSGNNYSENFKTLLISLITFFMFGLGTFFAIISLFYLDPTTIWIIVSLSIFSLLAGYASLITPMGLGVREGVMTLYLSRFMLIASAGLVSIFSRFVLIASEIIFLTFVLTWNKLKNNIFVNIEDFISKHKYELCLGLFVCIYIIYFTAASFLRYDNFFTGRFDLGNMDQTVWNTIHGRIFQITDPNGTNIISRLSFHADFILVLISPLYLIWSSPQMLLLLQSVILGLGAVFIFLIANQIIKNKSIAIAICAVYLLNPSLQFTNLYDFHAVVLGTTLLLGTFYFYLKRNYILFLVFAILSGLTKEDIWLIVSIFGLAIVIRTLFENKLRLTFSKKQLLEIALGLITCLSSALMFYLLVWIVIPHARGGEHFALEYFSDFGGNASDISKNILFMPIKTIIKIASGQNLNYLLQLLLPFGLTSLLSPIYLIFLAPDLLINLLGTNTGFHQIYYQYTAAITPFLAISSIYSIAFITKRFPVINKRLIIFYLISIALISAYFYGPLPGASHANVDMFRKQLVNSKIIDNFISTIPTKFSIAATNNLGSHLSRRQKIYTIPVGIDQADVVVFLLNDPFAQPSLKAQKDIVMQMRNNKNYLQIFKDGDFIAFEKRNLYTQNNSKPKKGLTNLFPYSITALSARSYQKSDITIEKEVSGSGNFKSFVVSFISDGLKEYALMNIPNSEKPTNGFPVLVIDHGYIQPNLYDTVNSYKSESDYFANNGFLVIKPDYRGNGNSEITDQSLMRFAYPIDVLNLLSSLSNISEANSNQVFLWSHSMGGEVTLEVLESIAKDKDFPIKISGAIFWAPVTDPIKWFSISHLPSLPEAIVTPYPYTQTFQILGTPEKNPQLWQSLSPLNYLKNLTNVPLFLQHGTADTTVPYSWSVELSNDLKQLNKPVQFISYANDNHNLPLHWSEAIGDDLNFLQSLLNK